MPDPKTIERLRGLVLSANDLKGLTDWPDALVEDYLNILDNLILLANTLDVETDKNLEALIYSTPVNRNFESRISELEQELLIEPSPVLPDLDSLERNDLLCNVREPFKFYLPHTVWDDLRFPASSVKGGGAFDTTPTAYKSGIVEAFSTGPNNESVQFIAQLPHGYKQDSDIEFHLHWTIPVSGAGIGAENVKWDFTYSWANMDGSFPGATSATITVDIQAIAADYHIFTSLTDISGTGKGISSIIVCSLTRDVGVANDYTNSAYFLEADFHFEIDTIGSRTEVDK